MNDRKLSRLVLLTLLALLPGLLFTKVAYAGPSEQQTPAGTPAVGVQSPGGAADYSYDAAGRLSAVAQEPTGSAQYEYDEAGNILSTTRRQSGELTVASVQPVTGRSGDTVTIAGAGFGTTASANTVKFGDGQATVTAASPTKLTVKVPSDAETGNVSVTTAAGTESSAETFTLQEAAAELAIGGFSPEIAARGSSVIITGSGFAGDPADNTVVIGTTRAEVTAATSTSLTVMVPYAGGSGPIRVGAGDRTATSTKDLVVLPRGVTSDQATAGILVADGAATSVTVNGPDDYAVLRFSGRKGQRLSLGVAGATTTQTVYAAAYTPYGAPFGLDEYDRARWVDKTSGGYELPPLPAAGTYQLLVGSVADGPVAISAYLSSRVTGSLDKAGPGSVVQLARPGQLAELTVPATKGDKVDLGFVESTFATGSTALVTVRGPHGNAFERSSPGATSVDVRLDGSGDDTFTATETGVHTVLLGTRNLSTGSVKVFASPRKAGGSISAGSSKSLVFNRPGQDIDLTYAGSLNQQLAIDLSQLTITRQPYLTVTAPSGSVLWQGLASQHTDLPPLPANGTYRITISAASETGSLTFRLSTRTNVGTLSATGHAVSVRLPSSGSSAELSFNATRGQMVSFGFTNWGFPDSAVLDVDIINPDGDLEYGWDVRNLGSAWLDPQDTGRYRIRITADNGTSTGSVAITLSNAVSGGSLPSGEVREFTSTRPGQLARYTFSGQSGQRLSMVFGDVTLPSGWIFVRILSPSGQQVAYQYTRHGIDLDALAATGTYHVVVSPDAETGSLKVRMAPRSVLGAVAVDGEPEELAVGAPGGVVERTFEAEDGERLSIGFTETDFQNTPFVGRLINPDGDVVVESTIAEGRIFFVTNAIEGEYRLVLAPALPEYGSALITVSEQLALGRLSLNSPKTVTLDRPGKGAWMTFDGSDGQSPTLTFSGISEGFDRPWTLVRAPDGEYIVNESSSDRVVRFGELEQSGRYEILIFTSDTTGSVTLTLGQEASAARARAVSAPSIAAGPEKTRKRNSEPVRPLAAGHRARAAAPAPAPEAPGDQPSGRSGDQSAGGTPGGGTPGGSPPPTMAPAPGGATGGDPVDLATGLLTDTQTDLAINDILPISVTRTYQQSDTGDRTFGFGTSLDYDVFLYSRASTPDISWLILPGGGRIRYDRVPGTEVFAADSATTRFNGSLIASNGNGYDVRLTDGTTMVFGLESPLREIRDRYGNTVTITRYPGGTNADGESLDNGPVAQVTSPSGRWIRFEYAQNTRFTRLARAYDNAGREVRYTYNSGGRLATATDPTGAVSSYTYDDRGRMATATDNRGTVYLRNEYDAAGRVSKQTMADGGTYLFTYITGANDKIVETRLTDPRGTVSRVTFNASSAVTGHTEGYGSALAQTTTVTWNDKDQPVQVTDPLGRRTHLVYDAAGRVVELTQFAGTTSARTRRVSYEGPYGQISRQVDPLGRVTTYTYASDGALRTVTDPMSRITRLTTDDAGRLTSSRDNLGNETKYEYRLGDFAAVTDPLGRVSRQRTDAAGRIVAMVDPLGNTTKLTYDANDRVLTSTDPLGQVTSTEYDPNGNPVKLTDPKGKATKYAYDELNHLVTVTDPLDRVSTTRYDKAGHPVSTTSGAGTTTTFDYDVLGRRTATRFGVVNGSPQSTIQYRYDAVGRVTSTEDSAAGTIANSYNLSDNLVRVTSPQGRIDYAYNTAGQRTSMTVAGQPATAYTYNTADQLTAVRRGTDAVAIGYDGAGRRTDVRLPNGVTQRYSYTNAGMVSSIDFSRDGQVVGDIDYTYDASDRVESVGGTMADVVLPDAYGPASYDAANQLVKVGATDYSYDRDGKLLSDGTTTYTWNARQQLTAAGAGDNRTTYLYDGQGRRIGKTRGGATTGYLHDGPNVALELKAGVTTTVLSGGLDQVFSRTSGGATTSLLTDALGSTVAVAGADGQPTAAYGYEPFGATSVAGSDAGNVTRYTGRDDEGNGLYFHRARFYSTTDQRFLSQDPLGPAGGDTNLYAYVGNQPTGLIDPLGLSAQAPGTTGDQSWWQTLIHSDSWNRNIDNLGWVGVVLGTFAAAVTVAAAFVSVPAVVVAAAGAAAIGAVVITAIDTVNSCGLNPDPFQCGMGVASLFTFGGTKVLGKITKSQVARMKEEKVARMSDQDIGSWEKKSAAADPFGVTGVLIDWFGKLGG